MLGVACLAFAAAPGTASAAIVGHFAVDPDTQILELSLTSDEEGDAIALGCSPSGNTTLNGGVFHFGSDPPIPCDGPEGIEVFGGGGNDTISFVGVSKARFTSILGFTERGVRHDEVLAEGGTGHDTMTGGPFSERFNALFAFEFGEDADTVHGNGGDDEIKGTEEADRLFGGVGQDRIEPGAGDDLARGGAGGDFFDEITYYKDHDRFFGEGGRDQMFGGGGPDLLDGGPGNEYMDGQGGKDRMLGRAGADGLFGSGGADFLFGHAGNDYLRGGAGRDHLFPGPGKDDVRQ